MTHTSTTIHGVTEIKVEPVIDLGKFDEGSFFSRSIVITTADGGMIEITVISGEEGALEIGKCQIA